MTHQWRGIIEEYRDRLPVSDTTPVVTLREGGTPLVPAQVLSERTGCEVHLKVEGANPTGSFKDRGMTMAISKAKEEGAKAVICASTGNTSASAAAYGVRAGMVSAVLVPQGKIALGKMGQALVHGAKILQVDGNFGGIPNLDLYAGGQYVTQQVRTYQRVLGYLEAGDSVPPPAVSAFSPRVAAAYAEGQFRISDVALTAGLRYDRFDPGSSLPGEARG